MELIHGFGHFQYSWEVENPLEMAFIGKLIKEMIELLKLALARIEELQCLLKDNKITIKHQQLIIDQEILKTK